MSWNRSLSDRSDSASIRSAVSGVRSRCDMSARVSRSCASNCPICAASRLRPAPTCRISGGPATGARADRSPPPSVSAAAATARSGRSIDRASWLDTSTPSPIRPAPIRPSVSHAAGTPWVRVVPGTKVRITAVPPGSPCTATRTSTPPGARSLKLCPSRASRTPPDTGVVAPRMAPPGRNTDVGSPGFSALTLATSSLRSRVLSVAASGASHCALAVAALTARSATNVRSSKASGTRNETRISELTARTRMFSRSRMTVASRARR